MTILSTASVAHCDLKPTLDKFGLVYKETMGIPTGVDSPLVTHRFTFPDSEHGIIIFDMKGMKTWSGFIGDKHYGSGYGSESLIVHLKKRLIRYREVIGK